MPAAKSLRMRFYFDQTLTPEPRWPSGIAPVRFNPVNHPEAAHALLRQAYSIGGGSIDEFSKWWKSLLQDSEYDPSLCFVAISIASGRMVGFAQCWTSNWIKDIGVLPEYQRQGIGRALLLHILRYFQEQKAPSVGLSVYADNPSGAVQLYGSLGFRPVTA